MKRKEYEEKRAALIDSAQEMLNTGDLEGSKAKQVEVTALDDSFELIGKEQANLNALTNNMQAVQSPIMNMVLQSGVVASTGMIDIVDDDMTNTVDYRKAFMKNVLSGAAIPEKFNTAAITKTTDASAMIPTTIMEKIIEKLESTGMILPLVTRTSYKGGLSIPTSSVKPTASWVSEGVGSETQKKTVATAGLITFNYYKLRCAIAVSLEVDTMALPIFETTFIANVVEAMLKANEQAIISGSGTGQPKGILTETVVTGQNVDIAANGAPAYSTLIDAEAKLPLAYESQAVWAMTKGTFMKFAGMVDTAGQPIARVNYGIGGKPERTLLGRTVVLNDYMTNYATTVATDTVVAFLFNFSDYILNTNYQMTVKRYEDNDTDDFVTKAIMLVDGKVVDKNSLVTITKKA